MATEDAVGMAEHPDREDVDPDEAGESLDDDGTPGAGGPPPGEGGA